MTRQHKPPYSVQIRKEAARRIKSGESAQLVSQALGMHQDTLKNWMPELAPPKGQGPYSSEIREEVIRRVKAGESPASTAQSMGVNKSTVERWTRTTRVLGPRSNRYSQAVRDEAIKRVEGGEAKTSVAKALGLDDSTIRKWTPDIKRAAVPTPMSVRLQAIERVQKGESASSVGRALNIKSSRIGKWLRGELVVNEDVAESIRQANALGKIRSAIASELQISIKTIKKVLSGHNSVPKYSDEVRRQVIEAIELGVSSSTAAKQFGCTQTTAKNWHSLAVLAGEAKEPPARLPKLEDTEFNWISREYPLMEGWRPLAKGWLQGEISNFGKAIQAITFLIERFIDAYQLPTAPFDFLRKEVVLPDYYKMVCSDTSHGIDLNNKTHSFLEWILKTPAFCDVDDAKAYRNPIPYLNTVGLTRLTQSNKTVVAYELIAKLRSVLASGPNFRDWTLAQSLLGSLQLDGMTTGNDWFEVSRDLIDEGDLDCVWRIRTRANATTVVEMWSPVRWVVILMKLQTPGRTGQWRCSDSGEADTNIYRNGIWIRNNASMAKGTLRKPWRQGVLRHIPKNANDETSAPILYFNTNKTSDIGKRGADKGQECPWIHSPDITESPYYWLERLRNWQEKYNPIQRPTAWTEVPASRQLSAMSQIQKAAYPDTCFLFRTPEVVGEKNLPVSNGNVDHAWQRLLKAFEGILATSGETHEDGSPILFIDPETKRSEIVLHGLRVSLITHFIVDGGMPPEFMMKIVGHVRLLMTLYYTKPGLSDIRDALAEAHLKLDSTKEARLTDSLRNVKAEQMRDHVAFNSSDWTTVLPANPADRSPLGWLQMFDGICLAGGNTGPLDGNARVPGCHNGGPLLRESTGEFSPVPGGVRNCPRCRWKCAGKEHGNALKATLNNRLYHLHVQEEKAIGADRDLQNLKVEKARAESAGLPFVKLREFKIAIRIYEQAMVRVGDLASDIAALHRMIERIKALPAQPEGSLALALQADLVTMHAVLEETSSELLQLSGICEDVEFYPDLDPGVAIFERAQLLDKALEREGHPAYFSRLSQEESLIFGNAFMESLARQVNPGNPILARREVIDLMDGHHSLGQLLQVDLSKLLPSTRAQNDDEPKDFRKRPRLGTQ